MRIHHFYPRTNNIGDHFVQRGIERMVRELVPTATFELFNVNSRGKDEVEYGLTHSAVDRANREADLVIVGGSNLYEGNYRWRWGVHLEADALEKLSVPLFLLGIGSGSNFASPLHRPSTRAKREIQLLNSYARFSGARDIITFDWLQQLGVSQAKLFGDPATFIFNHPLRNNDDGHILVTMPPRRFWSSKRQFWNVRVRGRAMFRALVALSRLLLEKGHQVVIACNDPIDVPIAESLFEGWLPGVVLCPKTPEVYFQLISMSRAVVSGRLHTAAVALSLGVPFVLIDADQRTHGFVKTYQLEHWALKPSLSGIEARLKEAAEKMLDGEASESWKCLIEKRDQMYSRAMDLLGTALDPLG
jgi:polysaccharide pyruvyl transferase WcaK-like protein